MPDCQMVSSGIGMFGDGTLEAFDAWLSAQTRGLFPRDFLFWDGHGFRWVCLYEEGMSVPAEFELIDFTGGLYAVATGIDQQTDREQMNAEVDRFLGETGLERDASRPEMGNIITSPLAREILGYEQMDYYTPVRKRSSKKCSTSEL